MSDSGTDYSLSGLGISELAGVLESVADVVIVYAPDGTIQWASPSMATLLGYTPADVIGTRLRLSLEEDFAEVDRAFADAVTSGQPSVRIRLRARCADGSVLWTDSLARPVRDGDGHLERIIVTVRDVTSEVDAARRFEQAMLHSAVGMALVAPDGAFLEANPALCAMLGRDVVALMGSTWQELTHPDDLAGDEQLVAQVLRGERDSYRLRKRYLLPDQAVVWGDLSVSAVRDAAGAVSYFVSQILDVTEGVRTEQHYALLAEHASDVVATGNNEGLLDWVSPSVEQLLGWSPADLVGHAFRDFVHPDDVPAVVRTQAALLHGESGRFEVRLRARDGSFRWINIVVKPVMDATGEVVGRIAGWRDVDADHVTREALDRERVRYRLLAENGSDIVVLVDVDGTLEWVSPSVERILGWSPDALIGTQPWDIVHPEDHERAAASLAEAALSDDDPAPVLVRFRTADGDYLWMSALGHHATGTQMVVNFRLVDEQVRSQEELEVERTRLRSDLDSQIEPHITMKAVRDNQGSIVDFVYEDANPAALAYLGMAMEQFRGMSLMEMYPSAAAAVMRDMYSHTVETSEPLVANDYAYPNEMYAGEVRLYDLRGAKLGDGIALSWEDVTERVRLREAIADSEARFRLLAENASDIVLLADAERRITWVSPSITKILGWKPEDLLDHRAFDFLHPDDLPEVTEIRQATGDGVMRSVARVRAADGSYRWIGSTVRPILGATGEAVSFVAGWRDMQAEKSADEARQLAEERYRLLAENASDVVYLVGPDRMVSWISPNVASTLGWSDDELVGTSMYELIHLEDRAAIDAAREAVFAGRGLDNPAQGYASRFRRKDGSYVWMSLKTTTITGPDGAMVAAISGMRNVDDLVTERKEAEYESARRQAIVETLMDPHVLLQAERDESGSIVDFVFVDANEAAARFNGVTRDELIGVRLLGKHPAAGTTTLFDDYVHVVETGEPIVRDDWSYPQDMLGGELRRYDVRAVKMGDGLSQTWRDVTERYETSRKISESERQFRLLAENSSDVVLQASDGVMRWLSPSLTPSLGWDPAEWVGKRFEDFTHPDDVALAQQRRQEINAGVAKVTTLRLRDVAGAYHWVEIHAGPNLDGEGHQVGIVASFRVVDAEVAAQTALRQAEEHYRLLAENSIDVVGHARHGRIVWVSPSITGALGGRPSDWVGRELSTIVHPDEVARLAAASIADADRSRFVSRWRVCALDGSIHWIEVHAGPFVDTHGDVDGLIGSFRLVDNEVKVEQELEYRARFDALTGLANRKEILLRMTGITSGARKPGEHTAVLFCDIDHFKDINDTYGHAGGDEVLRTLAERISANVRQDDIAARIGGDELLVILSGIHSLDEAAAIAEKIRDAASVSIGLENGRVTGTLSIGVTLVRPGEDTDTLIARADQAMYDAKQGGRNRVVTIS